jgi:hypothetical protein
MLSSFLSIVAAPAVRQAVEKNLFGKRYIRLGRLFVMVGDWVFQQGGALGYSLKNEPRLLGKLIGIKPELAVETIHDLRKTVASILSEVVNEEKTFFHLYTVRELRSIGIEITAWPPSKALETKVTEEHASEVMRIAFWGGAALGYHFPDIFREYWENTYRMSPDAKWEKARKLGIVLGEQRPRPLEEAIAELAEMAVWWGTKEAPELLESHEIQVLRNFVRSAPTKS